MNPQFVIVIATVVLAQFEIVNAVPRGFVAGATCYRPCDGRPKKCYFEFAMENYFSMSKACFNCSQNLSDCFLPDCVVGGGIQRTVTVVNRQLPGPKIEVCEGDTIRVVVSNRMATGESTTIHWHGMHMIKTPYMDGVPYVTQCPVQYNNNFTYTFLADLAGTHFWHSHVEMQRGDGVFGALIIRSAPRQNVHRNIYTHDLSEHVMVINDWNDRMRIDVFEGFTQAGLGPIPTGILINGLGIQPLDNQIKTPVARFNVTQNKIYRFRMINANFFVCPWEISIDNHTLIVISTDGEDVEPVEVVSISSNAGERFDFLVRANQPIDSYWIRVRGNMLCAATSVFQIGILTYTGAMNNLPSVPMPTYDTSANDTGIILNPISKLNSGRPAMNIDELRGKRPLPRGFQTTNYKRFFLTFDLSSIDNPRNQRPPYGFNQVAPVFQVRTTQVNRISYEFTDVPLLPARFELSPDELCTPESVASRNCTYNYCSCTQVVPLKLNEVVEMVLIDIGDTTVPVVWHPIHLHGFNFRVISMIELGFNLTREEIMQNYNSYPRNLVNNPPIKDTVNVPRGGITIIRFIATNPGYWFMHCHIENHSVEGMAVVVKVGQNNQMVNTPANFPTCGNFPSTRPRRRGHNSDEGYESNSSSDSSESSESSESSDSSSDSSDSNSSDS